MTGTHPARSRLKVTMYVPAPDLVAETTPLLRRRVTPAPVPFSSAKSFVAAAPEGPVAPRCADGTRSATRAGDPCGTCGPGSAGGSGRPGSAGGSALLERSTFCSDPLMTEAELTLFLGA